MIYSHKLIDKCRHTHKKTTFATLSVLKVNCVFTAFLLNNDFFPNFLYVAQTLERYSFLEPQTK